MFVSSFFLFLIKYMQPCLSCFLELYWFGWYLMFSSVSEGFGVLDLNCLQSDVFERENTPVWTTWKPPLCLFYRWRGKVSKNRQSNTKAAVCVFCFVLTACESGHPLVSKAEGKTCSTFSQFLVFPLHCQGRKITFLSHKESKRKQFYK